MTSDKPLQEQTKAMPSPSDLREIEEALRELRTSTPRSVLADLVDEKIRAMESRHPVPPFRSLKTQTRWIGY